MKAFPEKLSKKLEDRNNNNALRSLQIIPKGIDFISNDYLGFSSKKTIHQRALHYLEDTNNTNGSTGSRLISGTHPIHEEVERELANFHNAEAALLYNSGYDANLGLFTAILEKGTTVIYDELIHASIRDGIRASNARSLKFKHNDLDDLQQKISKSEAPVFIAVEAVYSMDGDQAALKEICKISNNNNCYLIVDEAHSNGVFGPNGTGLLQALKLEDQAFARVHTFGKALGCHGAVVLGGKNLRDYLVNFSRPFIYTTAASLHSIAVVKSAYFELQTTAAIDELKKNIQYFRRSIQEKKLHELFIDSHSPIQCCLLSGNSNVKKVADALNTQKLLAKAVLAPTVPQGQERLRICLHSYNTFEEIDSLLTQLAIFVN
ncbi:MAG: aminotransferase class I/II-fold pyridoxal phosphate-dependent enzyme [Flavicella sp.]